ncbi:MAG: cadherin domain-containing protein [Magnetococcales bacterium]|nr:cadherin domain-containing protein [Magnetococcales bacterium]
MRNVFQNKWFIALLVVLGVAMAGALLLLISQKQVENKGIELDRDKLMQRTRPSGTGEQASAASQTEKMTQQREAVGSVTQLRGLAFAEMDKEKRVLDEGAPIFQGDRIVTGSKARLILKMADDAVIALGEDSEFLVQQYTFKAKPDGGADAVNTNKGEVLLNKGIARFVSGKLGQLKNKPFHLVTPVATMGVRGTEGYIELKGLGEDQRIEVVTLKDEVLVWMEEANKNLTSSSGEIFFWTALINEAMAADLTKEPTPVAKNQMLSGAKGTPPVISPAPPTTLQKAYTNTVIPGLPPAAKQALVDKVAQSLVAKGAAASVDEAKKVLDKHPDSLNKLVAAVEDKLMEKTQEDVAKAIEADKEMAKLEEEIKTAEAKGDKDKVAELTSKKEALESQSVKPDIAGTAKADDKVATAAVEQTSNRVEDFAKDISTAVSEGKSLSEALENKVKEVKQEIKDQAKALGIQDLDRARQVADTVKARTLPPLSSTPDSGGQKPDGTKSTGSTDTGTKTGPDAATGAGKETNLGKDTGGSGKSDAATGPDTLRPDATKPDSGKADAAKPADGATKTTPTSNPLLDPNSIFGSTAQPTTPITATPPSSSTPASSNNNNIRPITPVTFNKPPVMASQTFSVDENVPVGSTVGTLAATDPDVGNVLKYTLTPEDVFKVDSSTGIITTVVALDYRKASSYNLTATVTDSIADNTTKVATIISAAITINVNQINMPPTLEAPNALSVDENGKVTVSGVVVSDPDSLGPGGDKGVWSVKLAVGNGLLNLTDTTGVTITAGTSGSQTLTIKGPLTALNNSLSTLSYSPNQYYRGSDAIKIQVDDLGFQGQGGSLTASATINVSVKPISFPPTLTDTNLNFSVDENSPAGTVIGKVSAAAPHNPALTYAIVKGNGNNFFLIDSKTGQITVNKNALLDFETVSTYTLEVSVADDSNPPLTLVGGNAIVTISINNINEPPTVSLPGSVSLSVNEEKVEALSGIQIGDPDLTATSTKKIQLTLAVQHGTLSVNADHSQSSKSLVLQDTLSNLRSALEKLNYLGDPLFYGTDTLKVTLDDLGNTGSGTTEPANLSVPITVVAVNHAPVITLPGDLKVNQETVLKITGVGITDVDAGTGTEKVTLSVNHGTLTLGTTLGLKIESGANGSSSLVISGTLTSLNNALASMSYLGDYLFSGTDTLSILVDDQGNSGAVLKPLTDSKALTITVAAVNHPPVITQGSVSKTFTESGGWDDNVPIAIDTTLQVSDVDNTTLASATIAFVSGYDTGKDKLQSTDTTKITQSWDSSAGILSLKGTATVAEYQAALRTVTYTSTSHNPASVDRKIAFTVHDGKNSSDAVTYSVTVVPVNTPPVLTAGGSLNYTEKDPATPFDITFTITDPDNTTLSGATVTITSGYQKESKDYDVLGFTNSGAISGNWNAVTGQLTLTGVASVANYVSALRSITFVHVGYNPSAINRIITTSVSDGTFSSAAATSTVYVTPVNDAPVVTSGASFTYTEGVAPNVNLEVLIDGNLTVTDAENNTISSAKVEISSNYVKTEDKLIFPADIKNIKADTTNGVGGWNATTGTLKLTGSGTADEYQAAMRTILYYNSNNDTPTASTRTVSFYVTDTSQSLPSTAQITVVPQNDPPTLTSGTAPLATYTEDSPTSKHANVIDDGLVIADVDNATMKGATVTITAATLDKGKDVLAFGSGLTFSKITGSFNATTGVFTLSGVDTVANYQTALRAVTYANTSDHPQGGNRTIEFVATDVGDLPSNTVSVTFTVVPVNDAPVVASTGALTYVENSTPAVIDSAITVTDAEGDNLTTATVKITDSSNLAITYAEDRLSFGGQTDVTNGYTNNDGITGTWDNTNKILTLTGTASVATFQSALATVTYSNYNPTTGQLNDNPTAGTRKVSFSVTDAGTPLVMTSTATTATVTVVAVNDPPVLTAPTATVTYTEDADSTNQVITPAVKIDPNSEFTITDAESGQIQGATIAITGIPTTTGDGPADTLLFTDQNGITGTWNSTSHTLTLTGTTSIANYQTALRSVTYINTSRDPGAGVRTLTWTVTDAGGSVNGGNPVSNPVTSTLTVVAVNDPPKVTNAASSMTYIEDEEPADVSNPKHKKVISSTVAITDPDNGSMTGATVTLVSGYVNGQDVLAATDLGNIHSSWNATTGILTLTGTDTKANYQTVLRSVTYLNTSDNPSAVNRLVQYVVNDGSLGSSSTDLTNMQSTITVVPTNDAPVLTAGGSVTFTEQVNAVTVADQSDLSKQPPISLNSSVTVSDAEGDNITEATVQITGNYQSTEDVLAFNNTGTITGSWDATTGKLTLTGTDTLASYQAALRTVTYQNTNVANPSALTRTVTWLASDGQTKNPVSTAVTSTIIVVPVNDSPLLSGGGKITAYAAGYVLVNNVSTLSLNHADVIDTSITVSDPENGNFSSATMTISSNYNSSQDALSYAGNGNNINAGVWNAATGILTLSTTAGQTATAADYQTALANVKFSNNSLNPSPDQRAITWMVTDSGSVNSNSTTATTYIIPMIPVGDINAMATLSANAKTLYKTLVSNMAGTTPVSTSLLTGDLRTMILAKLNQQITGNTTGLSYIGSIIDLIGVSVTSSPQIVVAMRLKALDTVLARLPSSVQTTLLTTLLQVASPYVGSSVVDVRLTLIPVATGNTITYDNGNSKLEVFFSTGTVTLALDTLVSSYNSALSTLTSNNLTFFLGGRVAGTFGDQGGQTLGGSIPRYIITGQLGAKGDSAYNTMVNQGVWPTASSAQPKGSSQYAPDSSSGIRLDYYLPGKISSVTFNNGGITLVP